MVKVLDIDKFVPKGSENLIDPEEFLEELLKIKQDCVTCYKKSYDISEEKKELNIKDVKDFLKQELEKFRKELKEVISDQKKLSESLSLMIRG